MSYHGGVVGALAGGFIYSRIKKFSFLTQVDYIVAGIPLGYTFGRIGNFLNGELYGRVTAMPWGMVFPSAQKFSASLQWVQDIALRAGMQIPQSGLVNLPRHPSQLYEAFFEGLILWCILWFSRKKSPFPGFTGALYTIGYGTARFIIEYFREPDADLGYRVAKISDAPIYLNVSLFNISTGQILCMLMIAGGLILMLCAGLYHKHLQRKSL